MNLSTAVQQDEIQITNRRFGELLAANALTASWLAVFTSAAIAALYGLTQTGLIMGTSPTQLLGVAGATLFIFIGFVLAYRLAKQGRGIAGQTVVISSVALFSIKQ